MLRMIIGGAWVFLLIVVGGGATANANTDDQGPIALGVLVLISPGVALAIWGYYDHVVLGGDGKRYVKAVAMLAADNLATRNTAISALAAARRAAVPALLPAARNREFRGRIMAIRLLGQARDARATPLLVQLMEDIDPQVRVAAAAALAAIRRAPSAPVALQPPGMTPMPVAAPTAPPQPMATKPMAAPPPLPRSSSSGAAVPPPLQAFQRPAMPTVAPASPRYCDVMISHSSLDKAVADAICDALEKRQIRCWIAPRDIMPGMNWGEAILDGIEKTKMMVLVVSSHANDSPQVIREVERAVHHAKPIVPFRIQDIPLSKAMEYFISSEHWLDAFSGPMDGHILHLVETVTLLAHPPAPTPVSRPFQHRPRAGARESTAGLI